MKDYIEIAKKTAEEAGRFLREKVKDTHVLKKKDGAVDLLTDADLATQELIIKIIKQKFPDHSILAEEMGLKGRGKGKGYQWVIDPIDGTSAFSVGLSTYSSSIALLRDNHPILGAIYLAITDEVIYGAKGCGVFSNKEKKRLHVKKTSNLQDAAVGFDPTYHNRENYIKTIAAPLADQVRILPMIWSQAACLALIARGILDGYIQCGSPKIWDVAAGKLLVEEAEGVVTDFSGKKLDIFAINGYVAGSKNTHQQLVYYLQIFP